MNDFRHPIRPLSTRLGHGPGALPRCITKSLLTEPQHLAAKPHTVEPKSLAVRLGMVLRADENLRFDILEHLPSGYLFSAHSFNLVPLSTRNLGFSP